MGHAVDRREGEPDEGAAALTVSATHEERTIAYAQPPATLLAAHVPVPGQVLVGRYTVLQPLGEGGMGVVLSAYDSRLDRRVALKLLHATAAPGTQSSCAPETRLLREAQAMARLSHPHVVAVYDAGQLEDGSIFIAMEHVEGRTLRRWCQEGTRPWQEVLRAFLDAGRGLEAAHAAGLVHRDFKPDNVLVGNDGRVRVLDFGVARSDTGPTSPSGAEVTAPVLPALSNLSGTWELSLTQPGAVVGTPRYLAPELLRGQAADVRSDLFAFCVSLYECLYGQPPFAGATVAERTRAQLEGRVNPPPATSPVPAWVARAVLGGLARDAARRPTSMARLLCALEDDPEVRRRARLRTLGLVGAVAAVACGASLATWAWARHQGAACDGVPQQLAHVWDGPVREQVRQGFLATGLPYARDSFHRVAAGLDAYSATWVRLRTEACEASRAQALPSALPVLQGQCLERRLGQLRALTELLASGADRQLLPKAVQAVQSLPSLEYCADARALTAAAPPPEDPRVRAQAEALQQQVDRLEALHAAARYKEGLAALEALRPQAEALGHAPLHAWALFWGASLKEGSGDYAGAEALLRQALPLAARGHDAVLMARGWAQLLRVIGDRQARHQDALGLVQVVETLAEYAADDVVRAEALHHVGTVLYRASRYEAARDTLERALALRQALLGPEHPTVVDTLNNLALVFHGTGKFEQARALQERILSIRVRVLGPEHPHAADAINNLAVTLEHLGREQEALAWHERALELRTRMFGPEHPHVATSLNNMANLLSNVGRHEEALARHERVLAIHHKTVGEEHPNVADSLNNIGSVMRDMGRYAESRAWFERALALRQKVLSAEHPRVASSQQNMGSALLDVGRYDEARERFELALRLLSKALGREHPDVADALNALGALEREQGRHEQARARHEEALALQHKTLGPEHPGLGHTHALLGRALVHLGRLGDAEPHLTRALEVQQKARGETHRDLTGPLLGLGELRLAQGRAEEAVALLERALTLDARDADVKLALARALWAEARQRPRAVALATEARQHWQELGHGPRLAAVSRWLATHAP